ncbi:MAG TPA: hypothetical protein DCZ94_19995 [Lentisphaeria bacterium]|nr:MAG: hypothetical protein A2X48_00215 [Lentisphaerae bacterium GWF2_49_21]HBC89229.1 hypothetical protein [Lentisphaeria bacterium]
MKIQRRSLGEGVYRRLLRLILDGKITAGKWMREEKLCKELGVSRTPLREALIRLVQEGILEQQTHRGCIVRQLEKDEIGQMMEYRRLLECMVLREWFDKIDRHEIKILDEKLIAATKTGNENLRIAILEADEELHEIIISACDNRFIVEQVRRLQLLCRPYRVLRCAESEDLTAILAERKKIIDAILNDSVEDAVAGLSAHFETSRKYYIDDTLAKTESGISQQF